MTKKYRCSCGNYLNVKQKSGQCGTCRSRKSRAKDPIRYSYNNKKNRCKSRKTKQFPDGIPFTITLEYFRRFCYRVKYIQSAGRTIDSHDCDRIDETKGYVKGNIQKLPKLDNIRKYHRTKKLEYQWQDRSAKVFEQVESNFHNSEDYF